VEVFSTLFAEILVWRAFRAKNADASAVLPDLADIALDEEAGNIFCKLNASKKVCIGAIDGRLSWVVLRAADAADGLVILVVLDLIASDDHVYSLVSRGLFGLFVLATLPSPTEQGVFKVVEGLRRQRRAGGGLVRRGLIVRS
jgi:hypothetical protein